VSEDGVQQIVISPLELTITDLNTGATKAHEYCDTIKRETIKHFRVILKKKFMVLIY
jgi:hypothetical protein